MSLTATVEAPLREEVATPVMPLTDREKLNLLWVKARRAGISPELRRAIKTIGECPIQVAQQIASLEDYLAGR